MVAVSVVAAVRSAGPDLAGFLRSVDAQSLPTSEFSVVLVGAARPADRLHRFAGSRSNAVVHDLDPGQDPRGALADAVDAADGDHVLVVDDRQHLAPRALEVLLTQARRTGADVVLGRVAGAAGSGSPVLPDDAERIDPPADPGACVALVRRGARPSRSVVDVRDLLADGTAVAAVGRYAAATEGGRPRRGDHGVELGEAAVQWAEGALQVGIGVRTAGAVERCWLVLTRPGHDIAIPAVPVAADPDDAVRITASLDPATADGGVPLADGLWALSLRVIAAGIEREVPLPALRARSAVVAGRPYVLRVVDGALRIDAGATRSSVIGPMAASTASITESARGALLVVEPLLLHAHGDAVLDARLLLDGFALRARVLCSDGRARLEAYVSAAAGSSRIAVAAGGGAPLQTGLRLRVTGVGAMRIEAAPPPRSPDRPAPVVQRLRRRLPARVEPLARRLAAVPTVRDAYRRLIGR